MKPKTPQQVLDLLVREDWHPGVIFEQHSRHCRNISADLIRRSLPLLRERVSFGKEICVLVNVVDANQSDKVVEEAWTSAIDALRALHRTSPMGTERERQVLLALAGNHRLVNAMLSAVQSQYDADPSWLAVFCAEGSANATRIVKRGHSKIVKNHPKLAAAIRSFQGARQNSSSSQRLDAVGTLPVELRGKRMSTERFWAILELVGGATDRAGTLSEWLGQMKPTQVAAFAGHFDMAMNRAYTYDLWGAAFVLLQGCSDDAFLNFRADLILRGPQVFERVLEDPDVLAEYADIEGDETLTSLADEVYEEMTGEKLQHAVPALAAPRGDLLDFDDARALSKRYPRLSALRVRRS